MAAAAAEKKPTEDGDIVAGSDGRVAAGTAGARVDDGFMAGQAGDANVEKATESEAEEDDENGDERDQGWGSGTTVEQGTGKWAPGDGDFCCASSRRW
jgi:hypothetical protein